MHPPEVKLIFITKNKKQKECWRKFLEIDGVSLWKSTLFLKMENKTEKEIVDKMMVEISRFSTQSINRIGVWCMNLLRNRLELEQSLKELNKKD